MQCARSLSAQHTQAPLSSLWHHPRRVETAILCSVTTESVGTVTRLMIRRKLTSATQDIAESSVENGRSVLARYKHFTVKKVDLADLVPKPRERRLTPRQIAQQERENDIRAALNEAASLPASQAVVIDLKEGQKLPTLRAAISRILKDEPRELNWGVRGQSIVISKGKLPSRGGPRQ